MRICTRSQNKCNSDKYNNNTSGYIGVYFDKQAGKFRAQITINNRRKHLGYYTDPVEAAHARDLAVIQHYGEFAELNFPLQLQGI